MKRNWLLIVLPLFVLLSACNRDPKEVAKKYIATGNKYYDVGKYKEASIMYRRALQKNMRDADAHYRLGLTELKQFMYGEAQRSFLRATDLDPKNTDALAKLGDIDLAIFMRDQVMYRSFLNDIKEVSKKLLDRDPNSYDGLRLSGFVSLANKDLPGAIQKFEAANKAKPYQPEIAWALAKALYTDQKPEEAEKVARETITRHKDFGAMYDLLYVEYAQKNRSEDAENILKEKVANNPKNGQYLVQLAFHYFLAKHPDQMNATLSRLTSDPKTFPEGHMLAGDLMLRIGDLDRAAQEYKNGANADPKNKSAYGKREVEVLSRLGRNGDASQLVDQLLKDNPKDTETVAMHASMLVQTRDPKKIQKAIDELTPLIASTPSNQSGALQVLHFNLARAYMAKGDSTSAEQARLQLQETLKLNRDYMPAKMLLAELMLSRGENPKAVQMADEVIGRMPNNLPAHLIRTLGLANMGETARARQELMAILAANPKSNDARFQLANLDFAEKRYKEAESGYTELNKVNDSRGFYGLVNCRAQQGDFNSAIQMVQAQLKQSPDRMDLHRFVADLDMRAKRYPDAIAEYQSVIKKDPSAYNYIRLGDVQRDAGQVDQAIASYKRARDLAPTNPFPLLEIAMLYDSTGRTDEARKGYEDVLKLQPDNAYALNNLAYSKADQGVDLDQALTYAERARQKLPDDLNVSDTIGLIYLRKNLVDESVRVLAELVQRAPDSPTFHLHYALALYQKGDKPGARKQLDAATQKGPSDKEKLRIQELRQKLS